MSSYEVRDVTSWEVVNPETVGHDEKYWLRPSEASHRESNENDWLFKPAVITSDGHRQGEDWSEKIAAELGRALGIPCADVELAVRDGVTGSISRNVTPDGWSFDHGSILLGRTVDGYVEGERNPPGRPGHSVRNIVSALRTCLPPPGTTDIDAATVFTGYLLLDALVGNQDRHDQNWAVLGRIASPGALALAASYDHASGLAFQRRDSFRVARLRNGTVDEFAANARANRFEHDPHASRASRPSLVETAELGFCAVGDPARQHWTGRLEALRMEEIESIVARVSGLSDVTRTFIVELVRSNRRRLLDECR